MSEFRRRLMVQEGSIYIPYQQIEYLESSGTQYIDTGISIQNNFKCEIEVSKNINQLVKYATILGAEDTVGGQAVFGVCLALTSGQYYSQIGIRGEGVVTGINDTNTHNFKINFKYGINNITVDNTTNYSGASSYMLGTSQYLFARRSGNTINNYFCGKIKKCKMYINDIAVRDFVPVRIGNIGYMYDTVSKQLFGNNGTGEFILGPDL